MTEAVSFFWVHAAILLAVSLPIALAERSPWYAVANLLAVIVGAAWAIRGRRPPIGPRLAYAIIVMAFVGLIAEYLALQAVLVMALSHFMMIVCMTKLLQVRSLRDDVQVLVLCLLLLVVGGIVSGDAVFAVALVFVMAAAVPALIRMHMLAELGRVTQQVRPRKEEGLHRPLSWPVPAAVCPSFKECRGAGVPAGLVALLIGVAVFVLCPRFESGIFRELQAPRAGPILTGLAASINVPENQTIYESDRAVMRVRIVGADAGSPAYDESSHYFRVQVAYRYTRKAGGLGGGWGWLRNPGGGEESPQILKLGGNGRRITLASPAFPESTVEYHFWLDPHDNTALPCPLPILELAARDGSDLKLNIRDQLLFGQKTAGKVLRYSVKSIVSGAVVPLEWERGDEAPRPPPLVTPDPPLPRTEEIVELMDREIGDVGPLDVPANREAFLRRLQGYLSGGRFTYTLTLPRIRGPREPIGEFLLETRRGHCEYFASAMAVMCQYKGIPARLVSGYRGGEYNSLGEFLVVRDKHAHAWVEAHVPGKGWKAYDPTPGTSRAAPPGVSWLKIARSYVDYFQFQWASFVVTYDAGSRRQLFENFYTWLSRPVGDETTAAGAVVAFIRELFGGRLDLSTADRLLYWVVALLITALVVLTGYVLVTVGRWLAAAAIRWYAGRQRFGAVLPDAEFYYRFCRRLEALGLHRRAGQTPAEFADELAEAYPALRAAPDLVRLYYAVAYGGHSIAPHRRAWIEGFLRALRRVDRVESLGDSMPPAQGLGPAEIRP
ncbi:MAG: DUF3488 domain-containing protein [Planctomycetes bacterium]|nr:DUF3488 domain-containing protein [Planctomycetota bacterium]